MMRPAMALTTAFVASLVLTGVRGSRIKRSTASELAQDKDHLKEAECIAQKDCDISPYCETTPDWWCQANGKAGFCPAPHCVEGSAPAPAPAPAPEPAQDKDRLEEAEQMATSSQCGSCEFCLQPDGWCGTWATTPEQCLGAAVPGVWCGGGGSAPEPTPAPAPEPAQDKDRLNEAEQMSAPSNSMYSDMLRAVNRERSRKGLGSLCYNAKLNRAAEIHTKDMASRGRLSHTGSDGSSVGDRVTRVGYQWRRVAENIARGQTSVDAVMTSWMNSSGHRANILNSGVVHLGFYMTNNYWTQVFGAAFSSEGCTDVR
jgi:uncharacterized protein YkwD